MDGALPPVVEYRSGLFLRGVGDLWVRAGRVRTLALFSLRRLALARDGKWARAQRRHPSRWIWPFQPCRGVSKAWEGGRDKIADDLDASSILLSAAE
eukprot:scaffold870_cov268-Pinguiococcus_pyrenoidosus.AAC.27